MKTTEKIAKDCGIAETRAGAFLADIVSGKYRAIDARGAIEETMGEIIGALYRRIETLEGGMVIYLAEKDREIAELCDAVNEKKRRIEKLEEEKKVAVFALQCVKDEYCEGGMLDGTPIEKIILAAIETVAGYADEQLPESIGDDGSIAIQNPKEGK